MAATFMMAGPGCCCCHDLYAGRGDQFDLAKISGDDAKIVVGLNPSWNVNPYDVDYVNNHIYIPTTDFNTIRRLKAKTLTDEVTFLEHSVANASSFGIGQSVGVHPWNNHLFYGATQRPAAAYRHIRRIDLDGTNDQTILTHGTVTSSGANISGLDISKTNELVFYLMNWSHGITGNPPEVRRCNADGTGDTSLWSVPLPATPDFQTFALGIGVDNTNETVYWVVTCSNTASSGRNKLWRCDFDGGNPTEIFVADQFLGTSSLSNVRLIGWSHVFERLYFYRYSSAGFSNSATAMDGTGVYSSDADGGDVQPVAIDDKWTDATTGYPRSDMIFWKLGCGYEKFGGGAQA